jgi:hypothetical protein
MVQTVYTQYAANIKQYYAFNQLSRLINTTQPYWSRGVRVEAGIHPVSTRENNLQPQT